MALTYGDSEVTCQNCKAVYELEWHEIPVRDADEYTCDCGHQIDKWNSTTYPTFKLKTAGQV